MADAEARRGSAPASFAGSWRAPRAGWPRSCRPCARGRECARVEPVQVGQRADHAAVDQLFDQLVAQALDVHRPPAGEVQDRLLALRGTEQAAAAAVVDAALFAHHARCRRPGTGAACGSSARRPSRRRSRPGRRLPESRRRRGARSPCRRCARPCGAVSNTLCSVALLTVVPPTNTGSSLATGVSLPVRPTWMSMPFTRGRCSCAGYLCATAQRGSRETKPSCSLQRAAVDLVDHAVDVERQRVALARRCAGESRPARRHPAPRARSCADRQAHRSQRVEQRAVRGRHAPSRAPRPGRRRRSSAAAGRRCAGSSWRTAPAAALRGLTKVFSPLPRAARCVRAPRSRRGACRPRRAPRAPAPRSRSGAGGSGTDGADVLRHVLAGLAVAARRRLHQHAALVAQVDRQAVELELAGVLDRRRVRRRARARGARGRRRLRRRRPWCRSRCGSTASAPHGAPARNRPARGRSRVGSASRRVQQFGMRGLERLQLLEQLVVLGVGDLRRVEHVVAMGVMVQLRAQLSRTPGRVDRSPLRRHADLPGPVPLRALLEQRRATAVPAAMSCDSRAR